jgi:hypothetical protein
MRAVPGLARLRSDLAFGVVIGGIRAGQRADFRVVHYSVQRDHVHLVVEAASAGALSSGMRGLAIRVARRLNVALRRRGKVWGDRWHGRALRSPREVRNALVYVLMNARKHGELPLGLDGCASIYWAADCFGDALYRDGLAQLGRTRAPPVAPPHTWLLAKGWRRLGLLRATDAPVAPPRSRRRGVRWAWRRGCQACG